MKRIITTFLLCLSLGCLFLHAERGKHIHETPEKQPDFITGFKYLPPGFECFADMFKYKVIDATRKRLHGQGNTCTER